MGKFFTTGKNYAKSGLRAKSHDAVFPNALIDNLVRSWTFAALEQVLRETATSSLPFTRYLRDGSSGSSGKALSFGGQGREQKLRVSEPKSMIHPSRSSSLNHGRSSAEPPYAQPTTASQVVFDNGQYNDRPVPAQESALPQAKNGLQELAGTRAQLVVVQRRVLEQIGKALGWSIGWAAILSPTEHHEELSDVDLDNNEQSTANEVEQIDKRTTKLATPTVGIFASALLSAASSIEQFRQCYEVRCGLIDRREMTNTNTGSERPDCQALHGSGSKQVCGKRLRRLGCSTIVSI
jgi:hypothetical protein